MMKRTLSILLMILAPSMMMADGISSLWCQYEDAQHKDQPETQLQILKKIKNLAQRNHDYGNLLTAELRYGAVQTAISPDSLQSCLHELENKEEKAVRLDPALAAIYQCALGSLYKNSRLEDAAKKSSSFYKKSLLFPKVLLQRQAMNYKPVFVDGADSKIFKDDLLHIIGMKAGDYKTLHDIYAGVGNREAACYCALKQAEQGRDYGNLFHKSAYAARLDSLMNEYGDLPIAGEIAISRFEFMKDCSDVSNKEKEDALNYALSHWGSWSRMDILRAQVDILHQPSFRIDEISREFLPQREQKVEVTIKNLQRLTYAIHRLDITGGKYDNLAMGNKYKELRKYVSQKNVYVEKKNYLGHPEYESFTDSLTIPALPVGIYQLDITSNNSNVHSDRLFFSVSDVCILSERINKDSLKVIVVSRTTGRPFPKAIVQLKGKDSVRAYTAQKKGEVSIPLDKDIYYANLWAAVPGDDYSFPEAINTYFNQSYSSGRNEYSEIYTERSIYRPGQQVHATWVKFRTTNGKGQHTAECLPGRHAEVSLYNANGKVIAKKQLTTDEFGSCSFDFTLPKDELTGRYRIMDGQGSSVSFRVEEYKRPTFEVTFPNVSERYHAGDTIEVKATARTFAGVPVQGARVSYRVMRNPSFGFRRVPYHMEGQKQILQDTLMTDGDGSFKVVIPLTVDNPENMNHRFYHFEVVADVVDQAGESESASMNLPLGTNPTFLSVDLPDKQLRDSLKTMTFSYTNTLGANVAGMVSYRFDKAPMTRVNANEPVALPALTSGSHHLFAVCDGDTLQQDIVVFSLKDKHPVVKTEDWFYQSATSFPDDGKPVFVQVGASGNPYIYYFVYGTDGLIDRGTIDETNTLTTHKYTYKNSYGDGIRIVYFWVKDGIHYIHDTHINKPLPNKKLNLKWTTFRDRLTAGQKEQWTLNITGIDGKPAHAQLFATLFDKSLDAFSRHNWNFYLPFHLMPISRGNWNSSLHSYTTIVSSSAPVKNYGYSSLNFSAYDPSVLDWERAVYLGRPLLIRGRAKAVKQSMVLATTDGSEEFLEKPKHDEATNYAVSMTDAAPLKKMLETASEEQSTVKTLRTNFNETAYFNANLVTDDRGDVKMTFTLPESVTTWRFLGLAHDKTMNNGLIEAEAVATKTIIAQPNMPRFIREGDKAWISTRLMNTSAKAISGSLTLQLIDPETNEVVLDKKEMFSADANSTSEVSVALSPLAAKVYICRVMATGKDFSDGEQHYLPVLSNEELVTNSYPFTQFEKGTETVDLQNLIPVKDLSAVRNVSYSYTYTNHPSWLMIQTLPAAAYPKSKNALSLMGAYYSNRIAQTLLVKAPVIRQVIAEWKNEKDSSSLQSALEKNEQFKQLVLEQTPWVMDADKERSSRQQLIDYFDETVLNRRLETQLKDLLLLQNGDGSWSWCPGMEGSRYMTVAISKLMARLQLMTGENKQLSQSLARSFHCMAGYAKEEVADLKKRAARGEDVRPSELMIDYLYTVGLTRRQLDANDQQNVNYLVKLLARKSGEFTICGKAVTATILSQFGYADKAKEYVESIRQYTVYRKDLGRYFDTRKAYYSWFDYKIPTQTAAIEVMKAVKPSDKQTITEMQRWLLLSKRSQLWDTPYNTVNAVWAFMGDDMDLLEKENAQASAVIRVDNQVVSPSKVSAGLGYVEGTITTAYPKTISFEKTSDGISWGAVYAQSVQKAVDITSASSGIKVRRQIIGSNGKMVSNGRVGDRVTVRITIEADRDYDFVEVVDKRAACLEPGTVVSGYRYSYYEEIKDCQTNYFFDRLRKGKHIVETTYSIDRQGSYQSGSVTASCAYAPEYNGTEGGQMFNSQK